MWGDTPGDHPDGICLDAEGAVWHADVGNQHCVRVGEGGAVLATVDLDRGAFACGSAEPRNLDRSFRRICDQNQIRVIAVHHLRHTTASLLKKLQVPPRDAQMILGYAHISTTLQIYTNVDQEARTQALAGLDKLLGGAQ